jgi:hypothetical protein
LIPIDKDFETNKTTWALIVSPEKLNQFNCLNEVWNKKNQGQSHVIKP